MGTPKREAIQIAERLENLERDTDIHPHDAYVAEIAAEELRRLDSLLWSPSIEEFLESVRLEAAHQVERWGPEHDADKEPADWLILARRLITKAWASAEAGDRDKALHHTITASAVLSHWHQAIKDQEDQE